MRSMTGYGRGEASGEGFGVAVDVKTVNNRYLDVNFRLPAELSSLENDLKRVVSDRLSRGRVDVNLQYERTREMEYELNRPLISGYLMVLKEIKEEFDLMGDPDLNTIARLPNAMQPKPQEVTEAFAEGVKVALSNALEELEAMREAEGASLTGALEDSLSVIAEQIPFIEERTESVFEEYTERLTKKLDKILSRTDSQAEIDEARLAQEVAYLAEKSDISEELARLRSHLDQFRSIIQEDGAVGKRLDFLTQELNREANTIGSKTQNLEIKDSALKMKAEIEKIREQVQNVE
ncbi:MAG TPA: YicC/YloC family endoribonuclease [Aridibacter sp.]|nr:YicC/YloC family endoribonuclease [Aridibacter sp.]